MVQVSIISPVYNVERYLPRFLKSIRDQKLEDYELILVDDGSVDNSFKICTNEAKKDNRIKVIHQKNQGSGAARNTGLDKAKGKYIYFCDPDDYLDRDLLSDNIMLAEKNNAEVVIFGYYCETFSNHILKEMTPNSGNYQTLSEFKQIFPILFNQQLVYYVWNKLYLHDAINKIRFERAHTGQDFRFNIKFFRDTRKVCCNSKAYYHYIINRPGSAQNAVKLSKKISLSYDLATENQQLNNLFFNYWKEENNISYIDLMNKRNMDVLLLALNISENLSVRKRKEYLDDLISSKKIDKFIATYDFKKFKEKYVSFILKNRKSTSILLCDKEIRKIWRKLK